MFSTLKRFLPRPFRRELLSAYAARLAERAYGEGCYSRAANYLTAVRSFTNAVGDVRLADMTRQAVAQYQRHLKAKGIAQNTISCYNRTLRAIYNHAVKDGLVADRRPFDGAFTGRVKTAKRSVSEHCIARLRELDLANDSQLDSARDYFLFSFYAMGMPFIDVAYLRKSQIDGDALVYDRRKTGSNIRVPLTGGALGIIAKHSHEASPYVFSILQTTREPDAYQEYCTRLNAYNRSLKRLARMAGIAVSLTSYTVRHSWASMAYRQAVPLPVISQALGHARPDVTMTYIRELDDQLMRQENDRVQRLIE